MTHSILLVEDEETLRLTLCDRLTAEGYAVTTAEEGNAALALATHGGFDLVVLDVMLPGKNGFDICRDLRQKGIPTPILMLTARREVVDKVVGLKLGADDYLTKPFDTMELLARIEALLRRANQPVSSASGSFIFGNIRVDFDKSEVFRNNEPLLLTPLDFKLLAFFIEHRGETLSRDRLLDEVWGYDATLYTRTVDVHVAGLRQKLEPKSDLPRYIVTVHRVGYKFVG